MKRLLALVMAAVLLLAGCGNGAENDASDEEGIVVIKEKMFITQTNEIYVNFEDYMGKTIRYEGFLDVYTSSETGVTHYAVIRNGPGCCPGLDNRAGFEVKWDGEWPAENEWVEVTGVLDEYDSNGFPFLYLNLSGIKTLKKRGAEYVTQ